MPTISISKEDYVFVAELAGKMQAALRKKVGLGTAAGSAARYVLSETRKLEELILKSKTRRI